MRSPWSVGPPGGGRVPEFRVKGVGGSAVVPVRRVSGQPGCGAEDVYRRPRPWKGLAPIALGRMPVRFYVRPPAAGKGFQPVCGGGPSLGGPAASGGSGGAGGSRGSGSGGGGTSSSLRSRFGSRGWARGYFSRVLSSRSYNSREGASFSVGGSLLA